MQKPSGRNCAFIIKIVNIVTAAALIMFGLAGVIFMALNQVLSGRVFLVFSPVFMMIFGAVLLAAQFRVQKFYEIFGFMATMLGRGIFNLYLSSEVFFYFSCGDNNNLIAWLAAIVIFLLGALYIALHFFGGDGYAREVREEMM